jgi:hypothetical protein
MKKYYKRYDISRLLHTKCIDKYSGMHSRKPLGVNVGSLICRTCHNFGGHGIDRTGRYIECRA